MPTTADDHILQTVHYIDVALIVLSYQIAAMKPPTSKNLFRCGVILVILFHNAGPAIDDLPYLSCRNIVSIGIHNTRFQVDPNFTYSSLFPNKVFMK